MQNKNLIPVMLLLLLLLGFHLHNHPRDAAGPEGGTVEAVVIEDSAQRTPAIGKTLCDATVLKTVHDRNISWRVIDKDDSGPDIAQVEWALDASLKAAKPVLCLRRGGGTARLYPISNAADLIEKLTRV